MQQFHCQVLAFTKAVCCLCCRPTLKRTFLFSRTAADVVHSSLLTWQRLDTLLGGGLWRGEITELVGQAATGKTQLCLLCSAAVAYASGTVAFIDTANSFSPKRLMQLLPPEQALVPAANPVN